VTILGNQRKQTEKRAPLALVKECIVMTLITLLERSWDVPLPPVQMRSWQILSLAEEEQMPVGGKLCFSFPMAQWFILSLWLLTQKHPGLKTKIHSTWL
jgi:hypothetical protein